MKTFSTLLATTLLAGATSAHVAHGKRNAPVGVEITGCTVKGTIALTFDDGPFDYTDDLLTKLEARGHRATFFQNGDNYGQIVNYGPVLTRMIAGGHQIGSHTWSHADLQTLSNAGILSEMTKLDTAFMQLIGKTPTYMRPPFLSYNATTLKYLGSLGYTIAILDIDTLDWEYDSTNPQTSIDRYEQYYGTGGSISLNHDPEPVTVNTVIPAILDFLDTKGLKSIPFGECIGDPEANWYRPGGAVVSSTKSSTKTSTKTSSTKTSSTKSASATGTKSTTVVANTKTSSTATNTKTSVVPNTKTSSSLPNTKTASVVGTKSASVSGTKSTTPAPTGKVSTDDTCGGSKGLVCGAGKCCSAYGFCGTDDSYCAAGCQSAFGICSTGGSTGGSSGAVSESGVCGGTTGYVCPSGMCCSKYGWCGTGASYCS